MTVGELKAILSAVHDTTLVVLPCGDHEYRTMSSASMAEAEINRDNHGRIVEMYEYYDSACRESVLRIE